MTWEGLPKMSLVAQHDDLCRYMKVVTEGCEKEFKVFAESQLNYVREWKNTKSEVQQLKEKIDRLESDKRRLETQMKHLKSLFAEEVSKRKKVESEKNSMERQIALIKEVLLADGCMDNQTKEKLAFLSSTNCKTVSNSPPRLSTIEESVGSLLSLSDYDRTDDDLDNAGGRRSSNHRTRRSKGKRSSSESRMSTKKQKSFENTAKPSNDLPESGDLPFRNIGVRSSSEPASNSPDVVAYPRQVYKSDSDQFKFNTYDLRKRNTGSISAGTPVGRYSTSGKLSRTHMFVSKTVIRTEKCYPCGRIIKFCKQALKCQDCRVICHPECKEQCPVPCIPTINTPTKGAAGTIADYTSSTPPMIPSLIVHCINEIEARGLKEIGLYRVSGSEREVKELKEKFLRGRTIPCLNQVDVHAICGTVKEFIRSLQEPLITRASWQTFVDAAELQDVALCLNVLYEAVLDLPQPNRDTLSFLILHLQRIAESPDCKMPVENLAKIFGPTVVGYSSPDADVNVIGETKCQYKVMRRLLSISSDSWQNMLNVEPDVFFTPTIKTPETTPAPKQTRLGPIYASGQKPRNATLGRTPLTPRNSKFSKSGKMHFSSPLLK